MHVPDMEKPKTFVPKPIESEKYILLACLEGRWSFRHGNTNQQQQSKLQWQLTLNNVSRGIHAVESSMRYHKQNATISSTTSISASA